MDSLIFDCDGVLVDSEPTHLECFQEVLRPLGVQLPRRDYYARYLGYDDRECFRQLFADRGRRISPAELCRLVKAKSALLREALGRSARALPGVARLVRSAHRAGVPLAVCSGALREEIKLMAGAIGVLGCFAVLVGAEDAPRGKPDPAGYRLALRRLRKATGKELRADRSIAVEDSPFGIEAARRAGLKVLAVASSYPARHLRTADWVVPSLAHVTLPRLRQLTGD